MLSDGAVASLLSDKPNPDEISLKIEWMDITSFANELDTCMYAGCVKNDDGTVTGWREMSTEQQKISSVFTLKQDAKYLQKHIINKGNEHLLRIIKEKDLDINSIDYFLPHLSSMFLRRKYMQPCKKMVLISHRKNVLKLTEHW